MSETLTYESQVAGTAGRSDAAITAAGLERRFGATVALAGLELAVERGEVYGFLGPNGAGKSTLIRILCTLLRPTGGTASVAGHDVVREPQAVRLKMGVALQDAALDERATGRELLELQAQLHGLGRADRRRRLSEVLDLVNLGGAVDRRIGGYSGGMKRRIDLAAALIHGPEVLFLDEPTTGLDPASREEVWAEVHRLNEELGLTVFLTTQYLEEADALADRIGIIRGGRLVVEGEPAVLKRLVSEDVIVIETEGHGPWLVEALRALDRVTEVTADRGTIVVKAQDSTATLLPLSAELSRANVHVRSLTLRTPTLDDVFRQCAAPQSDMTRACG
ncbi:MAG TPA: daunorubicin ABC transporter ATP-binding protein [Acidimicrobiaceae bacterium]|nr:daunorubicin ABC transporter ATP-binding protein [Acidimicrobiaceae bacterium]